jgi:hypothetical protein
MSKPEDLPKSVGDVELPRETVVDSFGDGPGGELLTVRLRSLWSDIIGGPEARRGSDAPPRSPSALPLIDDMKGIRHWD